MDEAPIKESDFPVTNPPNLRAPHFDEIAVAIAQPVEPIEQKRDWFAMLAKPRMMIAILMVAAMFGTTALALTLQLRRQTQVDTPASEVNVEEYAPELEPPLGAEFERQALPRRVKTRRVRSQIITVPAKPVARRVGVITGAADPP